MLVGDGSKRNATKLIKVEIREEKSFQTREIQSLPRERRVFVFSGEVVGICELRLNLTGHLKFFGLFFRTKFGTI
jgi:hypothetical protein